MDIASLLLLCLSVCKSLLPWVDSCHGTVLITSWAVSPQAAAETHRSRRAETVGSQPLVAADFVTLNYLVKSWIVEYKYIFFVSRLILIIYFVTKSQCFGHRQACFPLFLFRGGMSRQPILGYQLDAKTLKMQ